MADNIDALLGLGLVGDDSQTNMRALAHQLRGKQDAGNFYSLSPTVGDYGRDMTQNARQDATRIGGLSRSMGRDAYAEERDIVKDDQFDRTLASREQVAGDRNDALANSRLGTGKGMKIQLPGTDAVIWKNVDGSIIGPAGEDFAGFAEFEAGYPDFAAALAAKNSSLAKGAETVATESAKIEVPAIEEAYIGADQTQELVGTYNDLLDVVSQQDPNTSKWSQYFPTLFADTAYFESLKDKATLGNLAKWKLTPVSDRDIKYLSSATLPDLPRDEMIGFLKHKARGAEILYDVQLATADYLKSIGTNRPNKAQRSELKKILTDIKGDYEYKNPKSGLAEATFAEPEVESAVVVETPVAPGVDATTGIVTLGDGSRWNADGTPAQ